MVTVSKTEDNFIFNINGFHKFWALRSKIIVPIDSIVKAYQDTKELNKFPGFRVGTHIPFLIIAGNYYLENKKNFWDVMKKKNTIIVELKNHTYNKLYIQVEQPKATLQLLNTK